jgi:hypothetical protein
MVNNDTAHETIKQPSITHRTSLVVEGWNAPTPVTSVARARHYEVLFREASLARVSGPSRLLGYKRRDPQKLHHGIILRGIDLNVVTSLENSERSEMRKLSPFSEATSDLLK